MRRVEWNREFGALSGQSVLFAAMCLGNVGNFGFHALSSHLLGPASYGALGSVLSLLVAVTVPLTAYQAVLTAQVRRATDLGLALSIGSAVRRLVTVGAAVAACGALVAPAAQSYLHMASIVPLLGAAAYMVPLAATTVGWAVLTGTGRFEIAALAALSSIASRLATGYVMIRLGYGVTGAVLASVVAETVLAVFMLVPASRMAPKTADSRQMEVAWRSGGLPAGAAVGLWLLIGGDVFVGRHLFSGVSAGQYAAAATIARISMYLPQAAVSALLPSFAVSDRDESFAALKRALAVCGGLGLLSTAVLIAVGRRLTALLFGTSFVVPEALTVELSISGLFLGMLYLLVQYHLTSGNRRALASWPGVACLLGAAVVLHPSPLPLAAVVCVSTLLSLMLAWNGLWWAALPARVGLAGSGCRGLDLSVIVPYYNPGNRLRPNVDRLLEALRRADVTFEVIMVSDGCTDGSPESVADLPPHLVKQVSLPVNGGKGAAVCSGLRVAEGTYLGFIDADGDLDPGLWQPFLQLLKLYRPDAIVGSKRHPLSLVETRPIRRLYSRGYQLLTALLFRLPVGDTQVGLKVFRRDLLVHALPFTRERGFSFDLEVLAVARRLGYRRMMEAPVVLVARGTSTVTAKTVLRMLVDTLRIAWRLQTVGLIRSAPSLLPFDASPSDQPLLAVAGAD